jgi:hypothetical protein
MANGLTLCRQIGSAIFLSWSSFSLSNFCLSFSRSIINGCAKVNCLYRNQVRSLALLREACRLRSTGDN